MEFKISIFNLWLYLIAGYVVIWGCMALVNNKRGKPIEDPELYNHINKNRTYYTWYIQLLGLITSSLFIPLQGGVFLITGGILFIAGILMNIIALLTFINLPEQVITKGIYRFSRNPMYVGGFLFLLGLCIMGFSFSAAFTLFVIFFIIWIVITHQTVKKEEAFLLHKYGDDYKLFKQRIPRYIGFPKTKEIRRLSNFKG